MVDVAKNALWTVEVKDRFAAAHLLEHHTGKCRRLHGHTYTVAVMVAREDGSLNGINMVYDLADLKLAVRDVVRHLDHTGKMLNELLFTADPTCELVAKYVADRLRATMIDRGLEILRVTVSESPGSTVCFYPGGLR